MMRRSVVRLLAGIGAATVLASVLGAILLVRSVRHGFSARDEPSAIEAVLARALRRWSVPVRARQMKSPLPPTRDQIAEARAHWLDHCALCHARDGSGDTVMGRNLYPRTPDLRAPATLAQSDGELYYVIQNGVRLTGMPAWGGAGHEDADTWALVAFIRSLATLDAGETTKVERIDPRPADLGSRPAPDHDKKEHHHERPKN